jgi:hypothetical protein
MTDPGGLPRAHAATPAGKQRARALPRDRVAALFGPTAPERHLGT